MKIDETLLTGDYLGKLLVVPYYAAATQGSFSGNINNGRANVRELDKIKIFLDLSLKLKNPVLFDIGSCYGSYSFITLFNPKLKVEAFEPYPVMIEYMKDIIVLNNIPNIHLNEFGLSNESRMCDMKLGAKTNRAKLEINVGNTRIDTKKSGDFEFKSLDSLNIQQMDLVKIDVEGHEIEVFEGGIETFKHCKPIYIQVEINTNDEKILKHISNILNNEYTYTQYKEKFDSDYLFVCKDKNISIPKWEAKSLF